MKKFLIAILISTILFNNICSIFISSSVAHAEGIDRINNSPPVGETATIQPQPAYAGPGSSAETGANNQAAQDAAYDARYNKNEPAFLGPAQRATAGLAPEKTPTCTISATDPSTWPGGFFCKIISVTLLPLSSAILVIVARSFDLVVNLSLFTINKAIADDGKDGFIYQSWSMVRDLCAFIAVFLFLVSCFYMVIGKGVEVRKYIVKILIFAVMINFSFPISKAILDFSNIFALNIYGSVTDYKYKENAKNGVLWDDYGLSYQIAQVIGLQEPVTQSGDVNPNTSVLTGIDGTFTILGLIVMIMALAVVFAQATALFMTRTALMFLAIITSPIMFMGGILPGNSPINIAIDWWIKKFFGGAFLAPVMIINLALALQMMRFTMSLPASAGFLPGGDSLIKLVMMMLTIVIFQKAVEYSAKMLDGIGEKAAAIGGRVGGKMMSAGFARPAAAITRSTLGRGVSALMDRSTKSGGWLSQTSTRNGPIGNMARATLKTIDTGNQRLRNSSMNALGGAVKMASFGKIDNIVTEQGGIERDILEKEKNQVERQQRVEDNKAARNATLAEKTAKDSNEAFDKAERLKAESKEHEEDADKKTLVLEDLETERKGKLIEIEELENRKENIKSSPAYVIKMADHQKAKTLLESQNTKALWENDTEAIKKIKEEKKKLDAALLLYQDEAGIVEINKDLSEDYTRLDKINKSIAKINKEKVAVTKMAEQARVKSEKSHYAGIDAAGASIAAAEQAVEAKARSEALAPDVNRYREAFKVYATADKTADRNSLSPEALLGVAMTKPKKPDQMTQILEAIKKQASQNKEKGKEKEK